MPPPGMSSIYLPAVSICLSVRPLCLSSVSPSVHLPLPTREHGTRGLARGRPRHPDVSVLGIRTGPAGAGTCQKVGFSRSGQGPPWEVWERAGVGSDPGALRAPAEEGLRGLLRGSLLDSPEPELVFLLHRNSVFFSHWCPSWASDLTDKPADSLLLEGDMSFLPLPPPVCLSLRLPPAPQHPQLRLEQQKSPEHLCPAGDSRTLGHVRGRRRGGLSILPSI